MTHRIVIDLRVVNFLSIEESLNKMCEVEELSPENFDSHIINFFSFIVNSKTLNDSLIFEITNNKNISQAIQTEEMKNILDKRDKETLNNLKIMRDYLIHNKSLESLLFGTIENYITFIKKAGEFKEFLKYQKNMNEIDEKNRNQHALILIIEYLRKEKCESIYDLTIKLLECTNVSKWSIENKYLFHGG